MLHRVHPIIYDFRAPGVSGRLQRADSDFRDEVYHKSNRFDSAFVPGIALGFLSLEGIVFLVCFVYDFSSCFDGFDADEPLQRLLVSLILGVHTCVLAIGSHRVSQPR